MTFREYQAWAASTSIYPPTPPGFPPGVFTALGLAEEAGEVAGKIKKAWRDGQTDQTREAVLLELGDTLWYLSETARHWDITLDEVANANRKKLIDRMARGKLGGSGDNR